MAAPRLDESLIFAAGRLALDFVNTKCMRLGTPLDLLTDREDLERWLGLAEREFGRSAGTWRAANDRSLARALEFRLVLRNLVDAKRSGQPYSPRAIAKLNAMLRAYPTYGELIPEGTVVMHLPVNDSDPWLGEIARDAADLLSTGDPTLLRECECETCIRLFYDTTKNHRRRWCVEKCGSRVKAANYYRRKRESERSGA